MARTLWWTSDGQVMVDLSAIVMLEWKPGDRADEIEPYLEITFEGDGAYCQEIDKAHGNELMAAVRKHAGWPEGSPYRG